MPQTALWLSGSVYGGVSGVCGDLTRMVTLALAVSVLLDLRSDSVAQMLEREPIERGVRHIAR
jgi:hypothetical protein